MYCFDFDGVLCDTMDESLITSYNTYFGSAVRSIAEIEPALRDFFYEHRYLVRPAEEYYPLFHAFERGERVVGKDRFAELKGASTQEMKIYADKFYHQRQQLKENLECWECIHKIYPQCTDFLEHRKNPFFVVTNKDRDSVIALTKHYGFLDRIIEIYSRETSTNKVILMEKLIGDHGLDLSTHRIVYVDDHEGTLGEMKRLRLDLYLASWGYTGKPESSAFNMLRSLGDLPG